MIVFSDTTPREPHVLAQGSSATQRPVRAGCIARLPQDPFAELLDLGFASGRRRGYEQIPGGRGDPAVEKRHQGSLFQLLRNHRGATHGDPHAPDGGLDQHAVEEGWRLPRFSPNSFLSLLLHGFGAFAFARNAYA